MDKQQPDAFYVRDGDRYVATELTIGPWSSEHQHGGPPSALLAHEVERAWPEPGMRIARVTVELLKPVPVAPLTIATSMRHAGKRVQLVDARAEVNGDAVMRATVLRMRETRLPLGTPAAELADPEGSTPFHFPFFRSEIGYHTAMEARIAHGRFGEGAMAVWMRMRCPLVAGEPVAPIERVLTAADSGNGVSCALDYTRYVFINPDLSVHVHRLPVGEWVCLDARTTPGDDGIGLAETTLHDERGPIGGAMQTLLVEQLG